MLTNPLRYEDVVGQRSEEQQNIVVGFVLQCNGSYPSLGCYPFSFRRGVYCSAEFKFFNYCFRVCLFLPEFGKSGVQVWMVFGHD